MAYLRRHARSAFECPLILGVPPGPGIPGESCDLGLSGMGVIVGTRVPRGTEVTILLDPDSAPDELADLRRIVGSIAYSRSEGYTAAGGQNFRLGIRFHSLTQDMRRRLHVVIGDLVTRRSADTRDLPLTEEGREMLYQTAYEHLERRRWLLAREIAVSALRADRQNPTFRAFVHRVNAEEALAADRRDSAKREATAALKLQPDDPEVVELADRAGVNAPPPGGVIQRLFSRLKTQREG
jgi:hypothetical protein